LESQSKDLVLKQNAEIVANTALFDANNANQAQIEALLKQGIQVTIYDIKVYQARADIAREELQETRRYALLVSDQKHKQRQQLLNLAGIWIVKIGVLAGGVYMVITGTNPDLGSYMIGAVIATFAPKYVKNFWRK
jgi:hypothetical protein